MFRLFDKKRASLEILSGNTNESSQSIFLRKNQYLAGTDLPIRTNLEMVRIMKALNDSINTDVDLFDRYRYKTMKVFMNKLYVKISFNYSYIKKKLLRSRISNLLIEFSSYAQGLKYLTLECQCRTRVKKF